MLFQQSVRGTSEHGKPPQESQSVRRRRQFEAEEACDPSGWLRNRLFFRMIVAAGSGILAFKPAGCLS